MFLRLLSVWIAVVGSALVSFFLFVTAHLFDPLRDRMIGGKPLPLISEYFYPPASLIYLFPLALVFWGLLITFRYRHSADQCLLFCITAVMATLLFLTAFHFAIACPLLPMPVYKI